MKFSLGYLRHIESVTLQLTLLFRHMLEIDSISQSITLLNELRL